MCVCVGGGRNGTAQMLRVEVKRVVVITVISARSNKGEEQLLQRKEQM